MFNAKRMIMCVKGLSALNIVANLQGFELSKYFENLHKKSY